MAGMLGFFDVDERLRRLSELGDQLDARKNLLISGALVGALHSGHEVRRQTAREAAF